LKKVNINPEDANTPPPEVATSSSTPITSGAA